MNSSDISCNYCPDKAVFYCGCFGLYCCSICLNTHRESNISHAILQIEENLEYMENIKSLYGIRNKIEPVVEENKIIESDEKKKIPNAITPREEAVFLFKDTQDKNLKDFVAKLNEIRENFWAKIGKIIEMIEENRKNLEKIDYQRVDILDKKCTDLGKPIFEIRVNFESEYLNTAINYEILDNMPLKENASQKYFFEDFEKLPEKLNSYFSYLREKIKEAEEIPLDKPKISGILSFELDQKKVFL